MLFPSEPCATLLGAPDIPGLAWLTDICPPLAKWSRGPTCLPLDYLPSPGSREPRAGTYDAAPRTITCPAHSFIAIKYTVYEREPPLICTLNCKAPGMRACPRLPREYNSAVRLARPSRIVWRCGHVSVNN